MEIAINTYRCHERSKQWNDTSHISSHRVTVSQFIVILLILTCQLAPKSNSHISQSFVASVYKPTFFQCYSRLQLVQQCIQISTRINSSMYIRTSFVCSTLHVSSIRIFILIDPIFNTRKHLGWLGKSIQPQK